MKIQVIVGSTRPGRATLNVAKWVANEAKTLPDTEVEIVDLADYNLPFMNEPISPRYNPNRQLDEPTQAWITKIAEGDAYIFVTPEYNHSVSGVLKNAIDFLTYEMKQKPAAVVSHGGAGGARAAIHLKEILSESTATIIPSGVQLVGYVAQGGLIDENGALNEALKANPAGPAASLKRLLEDLAWHAKALAAARA